MTAELTRASARKRVDGRARPAKKGTGRRRLSRGQWSWRRWAVRPAGPTAICTRWAPLTGLDHAPAVLPGSYVGLIAAGVVLAWCYSCGWSLLGAWRQHPSSSGRCWRSQPASSVRSCGTGSTAQVVSVHRFLGLAVGRLGCFLTGCCAGRPSASRWAVWSSDRRVGARRIPTQLLESLAAAVISLVAWRLHQTAPGIGTGALLVSALAAYALVRQLLLRLRAEPRRSPGRVTLTAATAAVALLSALVVIAS